MSDAPIDTRRTEMASRLLVALLAGLFLLGLLGFVVAVLNADEDEGVPAPPSLPVLPGGGPALATARARRGVPHPRGLG